MRAEQRRRRKHAALADELRADGGRQHDEKSDAKWRDALPVLDQSLDRLSDRERDLVLLRFFEGQKFREMAERLGRSEAACKMGVKRALEKLSRLLTARGVTLSAAGLGSCLGAEFARNLPAGVGQSIAPKALAAGKTLGLGSSITNTVQTMSVFKSAATTAAAVLALAAAPLLWQRSQASQLENELVALQRTQEHLASPARNFMPSAAPIRAKPFTPRFDTVADLLTTADRPIDLDTFMRDLEVAMISEDMVGILRVILPVSALAPTEVDELVARLAQRGGDPEMLDSAMSILDGFTSGDDAAALERIARTGQFTEAFRERLYAWSQKDMEGALAWVREQRRANDRDDKSLGATTGAKSLGLLLRAMAETDPDRAIQMMRAEPDVENRNHLAGKIIPTLASSYPESQATLAELFAELPSSAVRMAPLQQVTNTIEGKSGARTASDFVDMLDLSARHRREALAQVASRGLNSEERFGRGIAELERRLPPEELGSALWNLTSRLRPDDYEKVGDWTDGLERRKTRDHLSAALASTLAHSDMEDAAIERASAIEDPDLKRQTLERTAQILKRIEQFRNQ